MESTVEIKESTKIPITLEAFLYSLISEYYSEGDYALFEYINQLYTVFSPLAGELIIQNLGHNEDLSAQQTQARFLEQHIDFADFFSHLNNQPELELLLLKTTLKATLSIHDFIQQMKKALKAALFFWLRTVYI